MASASDLLTRLHERLVAADQCSIAALDASFRVVLDGDESGEWLISLREPIGVSACPAGTSGDCTIRLSAEDFVALLEGAKNGQQLFFDGQLQIEGEMHHALLLQKLVELLK